MASVQKRIGIIGFGEAAMAFAEHWAETGLASLRAFDLKTLDPATAEAKRQDYRSYRVQGTEGLADLVVGADLLISLVTADQVLNAARAAASEMRPGLLYLDFNSASSTTKRSAAKMIDAAGGRYADIAVMSPVRPLRLRTPLLVSGSEAEEVVSLLHEIGFTAARAIAGPVGSASTVKMIRSVMVKGLEALSAECFLAAHAAGVVEEVVASLESSWPGMDWAAKVDYNLNRMMVHGVRRAAELEEAALTLRDLGLDSLMTEAAAECQRRVGTLHAAPPEGLESKARTIARRRLQPA